MPNHSKPKRPWTAAEVDLLRSHYPAGGARAVRLAFDLAGLKPRPAPQVYHQAHRLGLRRNGDAAAGRQHQVYQQLAASGGNGSGSDSRLAGCDQRSLLRILRGLQIAMAETVGDLAGQVKRYGDTLAELEQRLNVNHGDTGAPPCLRASVVR